MRLTLGARAALELQSGMELLATRSSDIAFTMGVRGRCWSGRMRTRAGSSDIESAGGSCRKSDQGNIVDV